MAATTLTQFTLEFKLMQIVIKIQKVVDLMQVGSLMKLFSEEPKRSHVTWLLEILQLIRTLK